LYKPKDFRFHGTGLELFVDSEEYGFSTRLSFDRTQEASAEKACVHNAKC